jgi:hypothetical protein
MHDVTLQRSDFRENKEGLYICTVQTELLLEIMTDDLLFKIAAQKETCKPHPSLKLRSLY